MIRDIRNLFEHEEEDYYISWFQMEKDDIILQ